MSKYEVKLVNIGEEVDNRIRELEIEVKDKDTLTLIDDEFLILDDEYNKY